MAYAVQISGTKSIRVYGPASTAAVSIEIDFKENLPAPDSTAHYVFDGRGGLSYAYLGVNSSNKIFWDVSAVSAFYIDGVLQSWTSTVTNFVGSGLDAMAGKTLKIVLTSSTLAGTLLDVGARYTYIQQMQMTVSAIRFLVSDVVTINYLLDEGTGTTLADSLAVAANGSIRNGDGSEWVADGGAGATVSATLAAIDVTTYPATVTAAQIISATVGVVSVGVYAATITTTQPTIVNASLPTISVTAFSAAITSAATITTEPLKNNTGTILASTGSIIANVYDLSTGALVVRKTGLTSSIGGVVTFGDPSLVATTEYLVVITIATADGVARITAE